jgi:hypothetical protein
MFTMVGTDPVRAEDVIPVHSRIAWGPILAGSVLALATYLLLTLVGTALGLSIHGRVSDRGLATGAVVWAVLTTAWSLFVGGFVASLFTTGENKFEGVVYGLIVWAVVFAMIVCLLAAGVRAGFGAMVGVAQTAGSVSAANGNWEEVARRNGATDADIARARADMSAAPASVRDAVNDPANRQAAEEHATRAAWYSVLGTVLSMLAAGVGGYAGSGPTFRLVRVVADRTMDRGRTAPLVQT